MAKANLGAVPKTTSWVKGALILALGVPFPRQGCPYRKKEGWFCSKAAGMGQGIPTRRWAEGLANYYYYYYYYLNFCFCFVCVCVCVCVCVWWWLWWCWGVVRV